MEPRPIVVARLAIKTDGTFALVDPTHPVPVGIVAGVGFIDLSKLFPIAKAALFNVALPAAEADWLGAAIAPTNSPSYLRIYACVSVVGILRVARTVGGVTLTENLNNGMALVAGAAYMFTVPWRTGDTINIRYSVTGGVINRLIIDEIGGAE